MRKPSRSPRPRRDIASEITALILSKLETGVLPWARPWDRSGGGGRPLRHCGTPYTGINTLFLWAMADACGFNSPVLDDVSPSPGHGRAGPQGRNILAQRLLLADQQDRHRQGHRRGAKPEHPLPEGLQRLQRRPGRRLADALLPGSRSAGARQESQHRAAIDGFFANLPVEVRHGGNAAYFSPVGDYIQMPERGAFHSDDLYASTRAHESVHWSGGAGRLERKFGKRFGDAAYAFEELVASIGQCLVCADLGQPAELHDNHASYIDHWLTILKGDASAIIHAASKAEQAFGYLKSFGTSTCEHVDRFDAASDEGDYAIRTDEVCEAVDLAA